LQVFYVVAAQHYLRKNNINSIHNSVNFNSQFSQLHSFGELMMKMEFVSSVQY